MRRHTRIMLFMLLVMLLALTGCEKIYTGNADTVWVCLNCGYRTKGNEPPEECPLCSYPKGYFERAN